MKNNIFHLFAATICMALLYTPTSSAQNDAGITLVGHYSTKGAAIVSLYLQGEPEIYFWDKEYIKAEVSVSSSNLNRVQLKSLASLGYYSVKALGNSSELLLTMSALPVTVNGMVPDKQVSVKLTFPKFMIVQDGSDRLDLIALEASIK